MPVVSGLKSVCLMIVMVTIKGLIRLYCAFYSDNRIGTKVFKGSLCQGLYRDNNHFGVYEKAVPPRDQLCQTSGFSRRGNVED